MHPPSIAVATLPFLQVPDSQQQQDVALQESTLQDSVLQQDLADLLHQQQPQHHDESPAGLLSAVEPQHGPSVNPAVLVARQSHPNACPASTAGRNTGAGRLEATAGQCKSNDAAVAETGVQQVDACMVRTNADREEPAAVAACATATAEPLQQATSAVLRPTSPTAPAGDTASPAAAAAAAAAAAETQCNRNAGQAASQVHEQQTDASLQVQRVTVPQADTPQDQDPEPPQQASYHSSEQQQEQQQRQEAEQQGSQQPARRRPITRGSLAAAAGTSAAAAGAASNPQSWQQRSRSMRRDQQQQRNPRQQQQQQQRRVRWPKLQPLLTWNSVIRVDNYTYEFEEMIRFLGLPHIRQQFLQWKQQQQVPQQQQQDSDASELDQEDVNIQDSNGAELGRLVLQQPLRLSRAMQMRSSRRAATLPGAPAAAAAAAAAGASQTAAPPPPPPPPSVGNAGQEEPAAEVDLPEGDEQTAAGLVVPQRPALTAAAAGTEQQHLGIHLATEAAAVNVPRRQDMAPLHLRQQTQHTQQQWLWGHNAPAAAAAPPAAADLAPVVANSPALTTAQILQEAAADVDQFDQCMFNGDHDALQQQFLGVDHTDDHHQPLMTPLPAAAAAAGVPPLWSPALPSAAGVNAGLLPRYDVSSPAQPVQQQLENNAPSAAAAAGDVDDDDDVHGNTSSRLSDEGMDETAAAAAAVAAEDAPAHSDSEAAEEDNNAPLHQNASQEPPQPLPKQQQQQQRCAAAAAAASRTAKRKYPCTDHAVSNKYYDLKTGVVTKGRRNNNNSSGSADKRQLKRRRSKSQQQQQQQHCDRPNPPQIAASEQQAGSSSAAAAAAAVAAAGSSDSWAAVLATEHSRDHVHPSVELYPGWRLAVMGSQLKYLADTYNLHVPAAVVLSAMASYTAAADALMSWHVGLASCSFPANLIELVSARCWPPQLTESMIDLVQDPLGHFVATWTLNEVRCAAPAPTATSQPPAAAVAAKGVSSSSSSKMKLRLRSPSRRKQSMSAAAGSPTDKQQQVLQLKQTQYAAFVWPLNVNTAGNRLNGSCQMSTTAAAVDDTVMLALPQGVHCNWNLREAEAAAAAAAGTCSNGVNRDNACCYPKPPQNPNSDKKSADYHMPWVELRYAALWQYKSDGATGHRYFSGTSWATLWPLFLTQAVQQDSSLHPQHRQQLLSRLSDVWCSYEQQLGDHSLPDVNSSMSTASLHAETSAAGAAVRRSGVAQTNPWAAVAAAFPDATAATDVHGLKQYLHPVYLHKGQPRSPYDLARDQHLWLKGAYASLEDAVLSVEVDDCNIERALAAMANSKERPHARAMLQRVGKVSKKVKQV